LLFKMTTTTDEILETLPRRIVFLVWLTALFENNFYL